MISFLPKTSFPKAGFLFFFLLTSFFLQAQKPSWDEEKKKKLKEMCQAQFTTSFLVYQDDSLQFSYGEPSIPYKIFSIRKSISSLLFGIYLDKSSIDLNATLEELEIDDIH